MKISIDLSPIRNLKVSKLQLISALGVLIMMAGVLFMVLGWWIPIKLQLDHNKAIANLCFVSPFTGFCISLIGTLIYVYAYDKIHKNTEQKNN